MIEDTIVTNEEKEKNGPLPINWDDINSLEDTDENYEVNPDADAFTKEAPPVPGIYDFLITVDPDSGITQKSLVSRRTKEKLDYYGVNFALIAKSEDVNVDGAMCYVSASTLFNPKKQTSTLITILSKLDVKVSDITSGPAQLRRLKEFIDSEPIKAIQVDWELSYKDSDNNYRTLYSSFKDFPEDRTTKSRKKEVFNIKLKDGSPIEARPRLKVISFKPHAKVTTITNPINKPTEGKMDSKKKVSKEVADLEKQLG